MRHGNCEVCSVTERRHGNQNLLSVTEKVSRKASWRQQGAQRHEKALWKAILVERNGKSCHGMHNGNCEACSVTERRHGNQHLLSVTEKVSWKA